MNKRNLVFILLLFCLNYQSASATTLIDSSYSLETNKYLVYKFTAVTLYDYTLTVYSSGSAIDVLIINAEQYDEYSSVESFYYYNEYSSLNTVSFSCEFSFSSILGLYLIVENSDTTPGGAPSVGTVTVEINLEREITEGYQIQSSTVTESQSSSSFSSRLAIIFGVVTPVIVIFFIIKSAVAEKKVDTVLRRQTSSPKGPQPSPQKRADYRHSTTQKQTTASRPSRPVISNVVPSNSYCPTCGDKQSLEDAYCSNCGTKI
ncbi:MAG: hypothetical protein ACTSYA_09555 [Candidatus Kariarchaeaceae archaeon]